MPLLRLLLFFATPLRRFCAAADTEKRGEHTLRDVAATLSPLLII